jgi:ATP-dependent helicase/nuclease subunit A
VPSRLAPLESEEGTGIAIAQALAAQPLAGPPDRHRFRRGLLTHALLQHLPNLARAERPAAIERYLAASAPDLTPAQRRSIQAEVLDVLHAPRFAHLFGADSLAEVPIAALLPATDGPMLRVTGQIDRLHVGDDAVTIIDFKANRVAPERIDDVPKAYVLQLAAYRLVLQRVYPSTPVRAMLLWTAAPRLMLLPDDLLDQAGHDVLAGRPWT